MELSKKDTFFSTLDKKLLFTLPLTFTPSFKIAKTNEVIEYYNIDFFKNRIQDYCLRVKIITTNKNKSKEHKIELIDKEETEVICFFNITRKEYKNFFKLSEINK